MANTIDNVQVNVKDDDYLLEVINLKNITRLRKVYYQKQADMSRR